MNLTNIQGFHEKKSNHKACKLIKQLSQNKTRQSFELCSFLLALKYFM